VRTISLQIKLMLPNACLIVRADSPHFPKEN
jgi:hypothetical protein